MKGSLRRGSQRKARCSRQGETDSRGKECTIAIGANLVVATFSILLAVGPYDMETRDFAPYYDYADVPEERFCSRQEDWKMKSMLWRFV
jgi:hypothetical protein